jgi:hypothetical protein
VKEKARVCVEREEVQCERLVGLLEQTGFSAMVSLSPRFGFNSSYFCAPAVLLLPNSSLVSQRTCRGLQLALTLGFACPRDA